MGFIVITNKGDYGKATKYLEGLKKKDFLKILEKYGEKGVEVLSAATPVNTGRTAQSWSYDIQKTNNGYVLSWSNSSTNKGISIVILNQYGHATRNGGWVKGIDFINPAIKPVFNQLADDLWKEVRD